MAGFQKLIFTKSCLKLFQVVQCDSSITLSRSGPTNKLCAIEWTRYDSHVSGGSLVPLTWFSGFQHVCEAQFLHVIKHHLDQPELVCMFSLAWPKQWRHQIQTINYLVKTDKCRRWQWSVKLMNIGKDCVRILPLRWHLGNPYGRVQGRLPIWGENSLEAPLSKGAESVNDKTLNLWESWFLGTVCF